MKINRKVFLRLFVLSLALSSGLQVNIAATYFDVKGGDTNGDGIVKVLAIGNSFSDDAVEHHLYGLARAGGKTVIIGNLYIGGAPLEKHYNNARSDAKAYSYRKIDTNGVKVVTKNTSISQALDDEDWDYISFQQVSSLSGKFETFKEHLPFVFSYVKERAKNPDVEYLLHQTWAYEQTSTHKGFANYDNDQMKMYEAIVSTYAKVKDMIGADAVVPAGTAIQNARTSSIGDHFTRDGYHLDLNIGRYTASSAWYEIIFGESVIGNSYRPEAMSEKEVKIAQKAAHAAVKKPKKVTKLKRL